MTGAQEKLRLRAVAIEQITQQIIDVLEGPAERPLVHGHVVVLLVNGCSALLLRSDVVRLAGGGCARGHVWGHKVDSFWYDFLTQC